MAPERRRSPTSSPATRPALLPGAAAAAAGRRPPAAAGRTCRTARRSWPPTCDGGVMMAGDRRATAGSMIAQRDIEKVFRSDEFSCVGIAGVAGIGLELVRLFQLELEHYEKLEGRTLSLEGKANRLATLVRGNLGAAMQGLVVVPMFAGLRRGDGAGPDLQLRRGRRPVRGAPVPLDRLRLGVRPRLAEEALPRGHAGPRRGRGLHAGPLRRGRRRLGHRRPGPDQAHLPGRGHRDRRRVPAAARRRGRAGRPGRGGRSGCSARAGRPRRSSQPNSPDPPSPRPSPARQAGRQSPPPHEQRN